MLFTFLTLLVLLISAVTFYVVAFKAGMDAIRWAVAGFLLGPALFPLFNMKRYLLLRESVGYRSPVLAA